MELPKNDRNNAIRFFGLAKWRVPLTRRSFPDRLVSMDGQPGRPNLGWSNGPRMSDGRTFINGSISPRLKPWLVV